MTTFQKKVFLLKYLCRYFLKALFHMEKSLKILSFRNQVIYAIVWVNMWKHLKPLHFCRQYALIETWKLCQHRLNHLFFPPKMLPLVNDWMLWFVNLWKPLLMLTDQVWQFVQLLAKPMERVQFGRSFAIRMAMVSYSFSMWKVKNIGFTKFVICFSLLYKSICYSNIIPILGPRE